MLRHALLSGVLVALGTLTAVAVSVPDTLDKWSYLHVDGSTDPVAPTWGYFADSTFDNRMSSLLLGFDTALAGIPAGLGVNAYAVTAVKLHVVARYATFNYDPTHDSYRTYLPATDPDYLAESQADSAVRPVELFGVGLRNGFTGLKGSISGGTKPYFETSGYATSSVRNTYPLGLNDGGALFDVSNNVRDKKEALPFGVGTAAGLAVNDLVPDGQELVFELQLTNAEVLNYVRQGLNAGMLGFFVSSMQTANYPDPDQVYPKFITREGAAELGSVFAPRLEVIYAIVPEPSPVLSVLLGVGLLVAGRSLRQSRHLP